MKQKILYTLFAVILGNFGVHDFYAKNWENGTIKFILTVCGWFLLSGTTYGIMQSIVGIWVLVDIIRFWLPKKTTTSIE